MANRNTTVQMEDLGAAISEVLTVYHEDVNEAIDKAGSKAVKDLVKRTRVTAPVGDRGTFKRKISSKLLKKNRNGSIYVWYVKAPDYRLTHLLVHGHATRDGGRTRSNPFLKNALDQVLPEYEKTLEEAIKSGQ